MKIDTLTARGGGIPSSLRTGCRGRSYTRRLRYRTHGDGNYERADKATMSATLPCVPNAAGANISKTTRATMSKKFHGAAAP
jgi:hypothetical protein